MRRVLLLTHFTKEKLRHREEICTRSQARTWQSDDSHPCSHSPGTNSNHAPEMQKYINPHSVPASKRPITQQGKQAQTMDFSHKFTADHGFIFIIILFIQRMYILHYVHLGTLMNETKMESRRQLHSLFKSKKLLTEKISSHPYIDTNGYKRKDTYLGVRNQHFSHLTKNRA